MVRCYGTNKLLLLSNSFVFFFFKFILKFSNSNVLLLEFRSVFKIFLNVFVNWILVNYL